jgi:membrane associated rhomboid family serine protease
MANPIIEEIRREFRHGSVLMRLIFINIGVFLLINIVDLFLFLFKVPEFTGPCGNTSSPITFWISVPADPLQLLFRPWTIFTYMFTHEGVMHILFNMLVFYFSGRIFLQYLSERKLFSTYILGGLAGAALFILSYNLFPIFSDSVRCAICLGASASVMAVMIAIATFVPNLEVSLILFGPVRLKYIALIYVIIDIISIKSSNAGGHIAHLGGAMWGYFYILQYKKGKDLASWFGNLLDSVSGMFNRKPKMRVEHKRQSDSQFNADKAIRQQKIDDILDKISKSGYESLSREEKDFLFKASNNKL